MLNGIIPVNKEGGFTSFDVCAKLRGILHQKKIGHTGTLDPMATGVLLVCLGSCTKLSEYITNEKKEYEAEMLFGIATDTLDITGEVINKCDNTKKEALTKEDVERVINTFLGEIEQEPPMYSAIRHNGKHLYELAREGITVERKKRKITIHDIELLSFKKERDSVMARIRVECSKGTYIRTLVDDIGKKVGTYATMTALVRTKNGNVDIDKTYTLSEIEAMRDNQTLDNAIISPDEIFADTPKAVVSNAFDKALYNGNKIYKEMLVPDTSFGESGIVEGTEGFIRVYNEQKTLIGLYKYIDNKCLKPDVFLYKAGE